MSIQSKCTYGFVDDDASSSSKNESKRHECLPKDQCCDDHRVTDKDVKEHDRIKQNNKAG